MGVSSPKTMSTKFPKLFQNNFEKVQKKIFLATKMVENDYIMVQILTKNLDFHCHLSTCRTENEPKNRPSRSKHNTQTLPELLKKKL